ncbi:hypothetical protein [Fusibacter ferrireducens]|uniref:Uncharacterized protein n=1 Tax=Fusibacter ferrireducens TaxID=2785058 RepID=A0ABR9ZVW9_9FIRM|nr:hypothetical protein [Fusibacter ferrireducens]MBF4693769.1 hypothetical protein [Fusibacter ferrireducens]
MKQFLTREDVDKILGVDPNERIPTPEEMKLIIEEVKKATEEKGRNAEALSKPEMDAILKKLGLENVRIYTEEEILSNKRRG